MTAIPEHSIPESDILRDSSFVKTNGMEGGKSAWCCFNETCLGVRFQAARCVMQISPTLYVPSLYHVAYYSFFAISRKSYLWSKQMEHKGGSLESPANCCSFPHLQNGFGLHMRHRFSWCHVRYWLICHARTQTGQHGFTLLLRFEALRH